MATNIKIREKDYNYCMEKLDKLRAIYDVSRDPDLRIEINHFSSIVKNSKVEDLSDLKDAHVLIGDYVTLAIDGGLGEDEPETYKLTLDLFNLDDDSISLTCPVGEAIYLQKVGSVCGYSVNNRSFKARIVSKQSASEDGSEAERG